MNKKYQKISLLALFVIIIVDVFFRFNNIPSNPISWDVFGYYLYLPFTFIYHDLGLKDVDIVHNIIEQYNSTATFYQAHMCSEGSRIMKYSLGMSVLYAPAFFISHIIALLTSFPADGFSLPYQYGLIISSSIYSIIGLIFIRKILLNYFNDKISAIVLLLLFFGTNYFSHCVFSAEMPHNHLFTFYALIIWFTIKWHENHKRKNIIFLAIFIGLTCLARPSEIISILIPLLWNVYDRKSIKKKFNLLKKYKGQLILFFIILLIIGSFQIIYWKIYSGKFIYYSYLNPGEGFEFLWPYTLKVLFSFRKGWLIYTPMMIFSLLGFISMYKENKKLFYAIFIFFVINLYIVSSWSCWWYAQCFSQRALVQSYAILIIPLGYFINSISKKKLYLKIIIFFIAVSFIILNLFQIWQIQKGILSTDRMTYPYYLRVFAKTNVNKKDKELLLVDRNFKGKDRNLQNEENYQNTLLKHIDFESFDKKNKTHYTDTISHSGKYALKMDKSLHFSPGLSMKYKDITSKYYAWIRVSLYVYPIYNIEETPANIVVTFQHKGKNYKYKALNFTNKKYKNKLIKNQWNKVSYDYLTPKVRSKNDNLKVYIWYRGKKEIFFDDFVIEKFEPFEK